MKVIHQKLIKERCGTVSFKRGEVYYRSNKVKMDEFYSNYCEATVMGEEDFYVTVTGEANGELHANCSCPKLASFDKDCQHIAAVLIAIHYEQRNENSQGREVTEEFFTLFQDESIRSTGHQRHFENRQVLPCEILIKPVPVKTGGALIGIELTIHSIKVQQVREFLQSIKEGVPFQLSDSFIFNQQLHCFEIDTDTVIQKLIKVAQEEKIYSSTEVNNNEQLLIQPSPWEGLLPLFIKAPRVKVEQSQHTVEGIKLLKTPLPLKFHFGQNEDGSYRLHITGLNNMVVLDEYEVVLHKGTLTQLNTRDCKRLSELKRLLTKSGTDSIPIPQAQIGFFLEKVAIGLKKLGKVTISDGISKRLEMAPLVAKLYLDRVKNRLLAGIEFHYENVVIHPLENREPPSGSLLIREVEKEDVILELMEEFSFGKTEGGYFLHNEDLEYEFLTYGVTKIQKLVQIYATTAVRNRVFKGNNGPRIRVKVKKERMNWLEFKFEMDGIPDRQIMEILEALDEKRKYYRMRNGSLLSLETNEFQDIQRFLHTSQAEKNDLIKGLELPLHQSLQLLDSVDASNTFKLGKSYKEFLQHIMNPGSMEFSISPTLNTLLREYQKEGYRWMKTLAFYGLGGILADDMGLGKTIQSISFIFSELDEIRKQKLPALIVCPSSLMYNWQSEFTKFAPEIQAVILDGNKSERMKKQNGLKDIDVIIISYPLLRSDIKWYEQQKFHTVFYDEAQAFKNPITQTARSVKKIEANHRFALTGTPVENSLEELWSIFHVVFPGLFRGLKDYSGLTKKDIAKRIRPFVLRRMKEDVLSELPEKREIMESAELLPAQKELYAAYLAKLRHDTLKHLDKNTLRKNRIKILAGLTRLRQICCHPGLFIEGYQGTSAKFIQLMEILEESRLSGRRVLIFSQFTKMLELIGSELSAKGKTFFYLNGSTPSEERVGMCNRFNEGERDLFLISLKAGGTGLNLTSADTVILYDTWWNPAVEEQAADRAHRMGQKNEVQVIKLISPGTIEEKMNELQEKKRHLIQEVIDPDEKIVSSITEDEIRNILSI
ncbi:SNF2 helicase associated domain-containing protein [Rossellomorea yichunensis]|uniref:SNF2 helicase associated domain-containing protein n=1 Tax=Rossellomorea yichunensis TaxID=3077331 RepID=UPI0028E09619|nr:SNF2 helicase associated domain-containing protein [Rossellomorea sp. YC4-1]MDT9024170.1 SNF2 helicase associated domain-containing protein [Rossellomorea sp. YC4-1]